MLAGVWAHSFPYTIPKYHPSRFYYWAGLWQNWQMFSPYPAYESHLIEASWILPDGSRDSYYLPTYYRWRKDPIQEGGYSGPILERFRKWAAEALPDHPELIEGAIQFANTQSPHPDAVKVELLHRKVNILKKYPLTSPADYPITEVLYPIR